MDAEARDDLQGTPDGKLYDAAMARVKTVRLEDLRKQIGALLDDAEESETHLAVSKYGTIKGVFVPAEKYRHYRELDGDPTDL